MKDISSFLKIDLDTRKIIWQAHILANDGSRAY